MRSKGPSSMSDKFGSWRRITNILGEMSVLIHIHGEDMAHHFGIDVGPGYLEGDLTGQRRRCGHGRSITLMG